jgi:hypothetical protein
VLYSWPCVLPSLSARPSRLLSAAPIVEKNVSLKTGLMSDESPIYTKLGRTYASHDVVIHSKNK